jgi:hypothetical protein
VHRDQPAAVEQALHLPIATPRRPLRHDRAGILAQQLGQRPVVRALVGDLPRFLTCGAERGLQP